MDFVTLSDMTVLPDSKPDDSSSGISLLPRARGLRVGAYTIDDQTSTIRWSGELLSLSGDQRQTLRVLLQHAGQILSRERLASLLHIASETVDAQILSLRATLETAGVTWLPRRAEGCGYILWR